MSSNERSRRKRRRSDRHKFKRFLSFRQNRAQQNEAKSENMKQKINTRFQKTIIYKRSNQQDENRTRSKRHENKKENPFKIVKNFMSEKIKKGEPKRSKKFTFTFKHAIISLGAVFVLALIAYTTLIYGGKLFVDEKKLMITPPTTIETKDGDVIWYLYDEYRLPVTLEQIPKHVQDAFIAIEDKRFYTHSGVDLRSIARAVYRDIVARSKVEGGSTLTQQLAKNLFLSNDKSWYRKIKEAMIALYLEREFTKDEILEMYLNVIYFGQGRYGIEAAANKYFGKSVEELTLEEGALLAGMVKAPNGYSPIEHVEKAKERRNLVLQTMAHLDYISVDEAENAKAKNIQLFLTERKIDPAYHSYVDLVIQEAKQVYGITLEDLKSSQYRITTGINETAQKIAFEEFQVDSYFPGNSMKNVEGAFVMMEQNSGEIAAAIGGRNFKTFDLNRVVQPVGQPGSTMKPIAVYAPALEQGEFTPFSLLPDELQEWDGKQVRNSNDNYEGEVTFYDALTYSKNTSSVWLLNEIGINYAKSYLKKMKIDIEDKDVRIALGGLKKGLSPIQLVQSYRTFIHNGEMIDAHTIVDIHDIYQNKIISEKPETVKVFSDQVAWNMTEMLKAVVEKGTGKSGYYPHELAGKTGTTQHPKKEGQTKDAWFVGMTPEYVTALWMGYDDISKKENYLTGGSYYPTVLTKKILTELDQSQSLATTFTKPDNVQALGEPIELPVITDLSASHVFGGLKLMKGKLTWSGPDDERIVYRVYEKSGENIEEIAEVVGETEFIIDKFSLFNSNEYYIIPYNPLSEKEGERSNVVQISF